jgi:hypothetical protein
MNIPRLRKQPVDTSIVSRMMKDLPPTSSDLEIILQEVSWKSNISIKEITSKSRKREFVEARQIYCKRAKETTSKSLRAIGKLVNVDHATVLYAIKEVNNLKCLSDRYNYYFNGRKHLVTLMEKAVVLKKSPDEVELVVKKSECLKTHENAFISPYRNIASCTNQPYMGYKS